MRGTVDSQLIEIIGRNRLINELLRGGLEVATPLRDRGIDLIAYHYFGVIAVRRGGADASAALGRGACGDWDAGVADRAGDAHDQARE